MSDENNNNIRKLGGGSHPDGTIWEKTKFKNIWRENLTDDQKAEFFSWFNEPATTVAMIRQRIEERYQIKLRYDEQISGKWGIKKWCRREQDNAEVATRAAIEQATLRQEHPDWGLDELREELLLRMKRRALAGDDFMLGLQTFKADSRDARLQLEREKFLESKKHYQSRALEYCLEYAKAYPEVLELFRAAFAALKKAKST
jgi:hypothetical protein